MKIKNRNIIPLEEGWKEIKTKGIDVLIDMLDSGIRADKANTIMPKDHVAIYTLCYEMSTQSPNNLSRDLYKLHGETIQNYLTSRVLPALRLSKGQGGTMLLTELQNRWTNHQIMNKWLKLFFTYLDRYYVERANLPKLSEAGLRHFKTHIYDGVKSDVTEAILALINDEREGKIIDRTLIKSTIVFYESMGMGNLHSYTLDLETPLLQSTREYYSKHRQDWIVSYSMRDYLIKAERCLNEERNRVAEYLNSATEAKMLRVCEEEILGKVEQLLFEKECVLEKVQQIFLEKEGGCRAIVTNDKIEDLHRVFRLFSRLEKGLNPVAEIIQKFISEMGNGIIRNRMNDGLLLVKSLLELHDKYQRVIQSDFIGQILFQKAFNDAFIEIVNHNVGQYSFAELISTFCDRLLKTSGENLSDGVEDSLDRTIQLFSYVADKDLFAEIYRNQLAKRLLNQRSASADAEKLMIAKLKMQCGAHFTSKMEGMLGDWIVGNKHRREFELTMKQHKTSLDFFSVRVLATGLWPTHKSLDVALPPHMSKCIEIFKEWHDNKHARRKVTWMFSLGNASVRATFGNKTYNLQVSTLQAIALVVFNERKILSYRELEKLLKLDESILKPLLHSLSCAKYKILSKIPVSNKINNTDSFTASTRFSSNMRKIRIPMASEATPNTKRLKEDRSIAIEAAIVRIMKARKTLRHQQLMAEVLSQLSFFKPNPRIVKLRIEALVEREYLQRCDDNKNTYNFLI